MSDESEWGFLTDDYRVEEVSLGAIAGWVFYLGLSFLYMTVLRPGGGAVLAFLALGVLVVKQLFVDSGVFDGVGLLVNLLLCFFVVPVAVLGTVTGWLVWTGMQSGVLLILVGGLLLLDGISIEEVSD